MSAAVAEPSAAVQQEAVAATVQPPNPIKLEIGGIVAGLNKLSKPLEKQIEPEKPVVPVEPIKPAEEKKEETLKEKFPVQEEKVETPEIKHNAQHFKVVVEARDKALARLKELEADLETRKTKPRDEDAQKLTDYEKRLEELQKSEAELREKIRTVDITQDPEFHRQYTEPVQNSQRDVYDVLVKAGVTAQDAQAAVASWDDNTFAEVTEGLTDIQKRRVDAAILETERLAKVRAAHLTKPEDFQSKRRQQAEEMQKKSVAERMQFVDQIYNDLVQSTPALADEANIALSNEMRNAMTRVAKAEANPKELIAFAAQATALQAAVTGQHAALVDMQAQLAERDKKITELETFVKANGGATLRPEATVKSGEGDKYVPMNERIVVKI